MNLYETITKDEAPLDRRYYDQFAARPDPIGASLQVPELPYLSITCNFLLQFLTCKFFVSYITYRSIMIRGSFYT